MPKNLLFYMGWICIGICFVSQYLWWVWIVNLCNTVYIIRHLSRYFDCLAHPKLSTTSATDQKWPLFIFVSLTKVKQSAINHSNIKGNSTMVNGNLLNLNKRYEDYWRVIFDQCSAKAIRKSWKISSTYLIIQATKQFSAVYG